MPPPDPPRRSRLVALASALEGQVFEVGAEPLTLGRQSSNRLRLPHASVSRKHCVITPADDGCVVRDLDSSCGTFVNGVPVRERRLAHGDTLRVGDTAFLFLSDGEPGAGTPTPEEGRYTVASTVEMPAGAARYLDPDRALASPGPAETVARHLGALLKIATAVHALRTVGELAERLAELVFEVVPAERAAVLLDEDGELATVRARSAAGAGEPRVSRTLARRVLAERVGVLSNDVRTEAAAGGSVDPESVRSLLCVPLVAFDEALGVVWADAGERGARFAPEHLELATAAAGIAAVAIANARRRETLERENRRLRAAELDHDLVGESPAMEELLRLVGRVAPTDLTVLVLGESGTGKELVARALHRNSPRAEGPFVAVNCATLSEALLESELFGHEKGAFTGAVAAKPGKLELAHGGTLLLDEVGEVPPTLQAKLLRALEEREFERVGGTRSVRVDVRIVAATNRDLEAAIAGGTFRRDLFHRLNVFSLRLPPLHQRERDVMLLAHHFAARASERLGRPFLGLTPETRACLVAYRWPGNVRELKNAVERAVVLSAGGRLRPEDLPEALLTDAEGPPAADGGFHARVDEARRRILRQAIEAADGNLSEAARSLGLNRTYLHRLVKNLSL